MIALPLIISFPKPESLLHLLGNCSQIWEMRGLKAITFLLSFTQKGNTQRTKTLKVSLYVSLPGIRERLKHKVIKRLGIYQLLLSEFCSETLSQTWGEKKTWPAHNPDLTHSWTSKMQTSRKINLTIKFNISTDEPKSMSI